MTDNDPAMAVSAITVAANGPYLVAGGLVARSGSSRWCRSPTSDGSHKETGFSDP